MPAHVGLSLWAECNHGLGIWGVVDRSLPGPGSNHGYAPSVFGERLIRMFQARGPGLADLREWAREAGLVRRLGRAVVPDPDTVGEWLRRMGDPQTGPAGLIGLGQGRADRASYQAARINALAADQGRGALPADQDVAVKAVLAGFPPGAWQEPERGVGIRSRTWCTR